jgi:hypothetical protein
VIPKLLGVLIGVTLAALALSLMGQTTGQSLLSQLFTGPLSGGPDEPPAQTNESFTPAQLPAVTEKPVVTETRPARTETLSPARPNSKSPSAGGPASTKSVSPRDADRVTPRQRETSGPRQRETSGPSEAIGTASRAPGASTPTNETGAPPKAGTGQGASGGRPGLSATARPSPSAPAPSNQLPARCRLRRRRRKPRRLGARTAPSSCASLYRGDGAILTPCVSWTPRVRLWWSPRSSSSCTWRTAPWKILRWAPSPSREPTVQRCRPAARFRSIFESA